MLFRHGRWQSWEYDFFIKLSEFFGETGTYGGTEASMRLYRSYFSPIFGSTKAPIFRIGTSLVKMIQPICKVISVKIVGIADKRTRHVSTRYFRNVSRHTYVGLLFRPLFSFTLLGWAKWASRTYTRREIRRCLQRIIVSGWWTRLQTNSISWRRCFFSLTF